MAAGKRKGPARKKAGVVKKAAAKPPKAEREVEEGGDDSELEVEPSTSGGEASGVVYIGRLPHGFYEKELKAFFTQFGDVKRWRVSRSKRNAKSKGYAFVEFEHPEVAAIAADAMNGYMMFKQVLKCHVMKKDQVHPELFTKKNRTMKKVPWRRLEVARVNKVRTAEESGRRAQRAVRRDKKRQEAIKKAGIDYEYTPLSAKLPPKPVHQKFDD